MGGFYFILFFLSVISIRPCSFWETRAPTKIKKDFLFSSSCPLSDLKSALREETSRGYAPAPSELTGFLLILSRGRRWASVISLLLVRYLILNPRYVRKLVGATLPPLQN